MTLPPYQYDVSGRRGIGVAQQSALDFPLVTPSTDIRYLLADFWLSYEAPVDYDEEATALRHPLRLAWLYGIGYVENSAPDWAPTPTHAADLLIRDSDGHTVFDSTVGDYTTKVWNTAYTIHQWVTETAVCRIVVHTHWPDASGPTPRNYDQHLVPDCAVLDERTVNRVPRRLLSLSVVLDTLARTGIVFDAGFNVRIDVADLGFLPGKRRQTRLTFHAIPGEGTGRYTACEDPDNPIRRINGVGPNEHGDVFLQGTDCLYVRQPLTVLSTNPYVVTPSRNVNPSAAHLVIGNDCGPCCTCDAMLTAAEYMNQLRDEYAALAARVIATRDQYHENRARWLASAECRLAKPLRISLQPQTGPYIDVAGQFCNQSDECRENLVMTFTFATVPEGDAPTVVCGTTRITNSLPRESNRPYVLDGAWPSFTAYWDVVNAFESVNVRFRLRFPSGGLSDDGEPRALTGTVSALIDGEALEATAEKTATLNSLDDSC